MGRTRVTRVHPARLRSPVCCRQSGPAGSYRRRAFGTWRNRNCNTGATRQRQRDEKRFVSKHLSSGINRLVSGRSRVQVPQPAPLLLARVGISVPGFDAAPETGFGRGTKVEGSTIVPAPPGSPRTRPFVRSTPPMPRALRARMGEADPRGVRRRSGADASLEEEGRAPHRLVATARGLPVPRGRRHRHRRSGNCRGPSTAARSGRAARTARRAAWRRDRTWRRRWPCRG